MSKRLGLAAAVLAVACVNSTDDPSESVDSVEQEISGVHTAVGLGGGTPGTSRHFRLVGHDPLFGRGMNAASALFEQ